MKNLLKTLFVFLTITVTFLSLSNVKALSQGDTYFIWKRSDIDQTSRLKKTSTGGTIETSYVGYTENNSFFPAYCNNAYKDGVGGLNNHPGYNVTVTGMAEDAVWRVISNGYPYRTPAELGVANEYDAFTATKHATYVVIGQSPLSVYAGKDARGVKIVAAIKNLVNKSTGITGLTQYQAPNFNVTTSPVTEQGDYIVMSLVGSSSPIVVDKLDVTLSGNVPAGTKITDASGNEKSSFIDQEEIKIMVPKDSFEKSVSFNINLNARFATYRVYFAKAPSDDLQDYYMTTDKYEYDSLVKQFNYTKEETERTCDDIIKEYEECEKDGTCSEELTKEYEACVPDRTCDDIIKEYEECEKDDSCSEELTKEYEACIPDRTCDDIIKEYEECEKDGTCSEELENEYAACVPISEEPNPNTSGMNVLLTSLMVLGAGGTGAYAYRKRKLFEVK